MFEWDDAHAHVGDSDNIDNSDREQSSDRVGSVLLMGTHPDVDWHRVRHLHLADPGRFRACYGIHPWLAVTHLQNQTAVDSALAQLEEHLLADPLALVGEIGLDKTMRVKNEGGEPHMRPLTADEWQRQVAVFEEQLNMAGRLQRPVSVHCVNASGQMLSTLQRQTSPAPPAVMMHSYGGSVDSMRQLLRLSIPIFFGFSRLVNGRVRSDKLHALLHAVPADRLLLETDAPWPGSCKDLRWVAEQVARCKQWTLHQTAAACRANFDSFVASVQHS